MINRYQYIQIQELISGASSKEDLIKIGLLLKALPDCSEKQDLVDTFAQRWVNV